MKQSISSCLVSKKSNFRASSQRKGHTLYAFHPTLMKWDWDIPDDAHSQANLTLTRRGQVKGYLTCSRWAKSQAWGITASWGGVNAYCLSTPMSLKGMSPSSLLDLRAYMEGANVDPCYVRLAQKPNYVWCSRVMPKSWRPEETWTGVLLGYFNPSNSPVDPQLQKEFEKMLSYYSIFSADAPPASELW